MTRYEFALHEACQSMYIIEYETSYGRGHMEVKTSFYNKYIDKFTKVFKDANIKSFKEIKL